MPRMFFNLNIPASEYQSFYNGIYKVILARAENRQRLQFPANELRKFVSHTGVQGRFEITFSADHKLLELKKVG